MRYAMRVLPGGLCPKCFGSVYFDSDEHGRFLACLCGWQQDIVPESRPCPVRMAKTDGRRRYSDSVRDEVIRRRRLGATCREVAEVMRIPFSAVQYWCRNLEDVEHRRGRRRGKDMSTNVLTPAFPAWPSAGPTVIIERTF